MAHRLAPAAAAGLAAGILFYLHAMIPQSHAWPLMWPLAGGAAAVYLSARRGADQAGEVRGFRLGAQAGVIAGVLFFAMSLPTLYALSFPALARVARLLGGTGAPLPTGAVALSLAIAAVIGLGASVTGSMLAAPVLRRRAH